MAGRANIGRRLFFDGYDVSGDHNDLTVRVMRDEKDKTNLLNTAVSRHKGMRSFELSHGGYFNAGTGGIDPAMFTNLTGTSNTIVTAGMTGAATGEPCYFTTGPRMEYSHTGNMGDMYGFTGMIAGGGEPIIRGTSMIYDTVTSSDDGTGYELGAVSSSQKVYAAIHVLSATAADTLNVILESDSSGAFASPTTRITFSEFTDAVGAEFKSTSGAITDTYWRVSYTITGTDPSYQFIVVAGIL